jgi:hypothetical protein
VFVVGVVGELPNERIRMGALMLEQSWFARRGTGTDVSQYAEFGGPVPAIDRDTEQLLGISRGFRPAVA